MSTARELTNHLARLLREEQGAMADFLLALADFDRKKLWRELGHTSLRCGDGPLHAPAFDAGAEPAVPCDRPRDIERWFQAAASGGPPGLIRVISSLLLRMNGTKARLRAAGDAP